MINLYLLGKKGLESIERLSPTLWSKINVICIGKDSAIVDDYSAEIVDFAAKHAIPHYYRGGTFPDNVGPGSLNIAIGWRWLISLELPLIVFHDSILPKYRGFNPLVTALINGDKQIGVTALIGTDEFDKGDIIAQKSIEIEYPIKIEEAINLLSREYAALLEEVFHLYLSDAIAPKQQNEQYATYSLWRDEEDYHIDWSSDSGSIKRMIDAVGFPYNGAFTYIDGIKSRIFDVEEVPDVLIANRTPGKVIFKENDEFTVVCGKGLLKVRDFYNDDSQKVKQSKFRIRFK